MRKIKNKILYLSLLLFMFFQTLNVSVLPFYILNISETPDVFSFGFSLFSFGMFVGSIILGIISDKYSRKKMVIIFVPIYAALQLFIPIVDSVIILYINRFISGFVLSGVVANTIPLIMENIDNDEKIVSNFTVYGSVLVTLGTLSGGLLANYISYRFPLLIQFILSLIISILFALVIDESKQNRIKKIKIKISPIQKKIIFINSLYIMIFFFLFQASRYILITNYNLNPAGISYVSAYTGVLGLIIGSLIYPKLAKKFSKIKVIYFAYFLLMIGLLSVTISNSFISIAIFFTLCISPQNLVKIPMNIILTNNVKESKGYVFGINNSLISLFSGIGSMLVAPFFNNYNPILLLVIVLIIILLIILTHCLEKELYY